MNLFFSFFVYFSFLGSSQSFEKFEIKHQNISREFYVYFPKKNVSNFPLLFVLHAASDNPQKMINLTKASFNKLAHSKNFVVVYPQGYKGYFNDGRKKPNYEAFKRNIDDVGFIENIIYYLYNNYEIDIRKVFFVGFSNGAFMAFKLACESHFVKGIGVVSASLPKELYGCNPNSSLSVIIIAGTNDPFVPYNGGEIKAPFGVRWLGDVIKVEDTYAFWSAKNGCDIKNEIIEELRDPFDKSMVLIKRIRKCPTTKVGLYTINGGGHTWPGGMQYLSISMAGKTFSGFDAAEEIVNFLIE